MAGFRRENMRPCYSPPKSYDYLKTIKNIKVNPYAAGGKFGKYKMMQKTETMAYGYSYESSQWELSNEYLHDRV